MAQFLNDTFSSSDVQLSSHTGETGATWTRIFDSGGTSTKVISGYANFSNSAQIWTASGTPAGADYEVSAVTTYQGNLAADFHITGPAGRLAGTGDGYFCAWRTDAGQIQLHKVTNGSRTLIGSSNQTTPSSGTNVTLTLRMVGSTISVKKDGTEIISVTDTTYTAAGKAGIHGRTASYAGALSGQTDGWPITSITADDIAGGSSINLSMVERNSITRGLNRGLS
jgi:hypothetical protein